MNMNEETFCRQGNEYASKGLYEMAISQFSKAIAINSSCAEAFTGRGLIYCLHIQDLYEEALSDFSRAIELNPKDPVPYHGRGMIYYIKGLYDLALLDFTSVLELNPKWGSGLYKSRADIYLRKGCFIEAERDFSQAIELNPESGPSYLGRAIALFYLSQHDAALQDIQSAGDKGAEIERNDMDPDFLAWLESVNLEKNHPDAGHKENASVLIFPSVFKSEKIANR